MLQESLPVVLWRFYKVCRFFKFLFGHIVMFSSLLSLLLDLDSQCNRIEQSLLLRDGILSSAWSSLSGGERQRAAIAIGLLLGCSVDERSFNDAKSIEYPKAVLLLDEPTAACDATSCKAVEKALIVSGLAMIIITHDERQAQRIAHRRIVIDQKIT